MQETITKWVELIIARVNLDIGITFDKEGIEIPFPQRVNHQVKN